MTNINTNSNPLLASLGQAFKPAERANADRVMDLYVDPIRDVASDIWELVPGLPAALMDGSSEAPALDRRQVAAGYRMRIKILDRLSKTGVTLRTTAVTVVKSRRDEQSLQDDCVQMAQELRAIEPKVTADLHAKGAFADKSAEEIRGLIQEATSRGILEHLNPLDWESLGEGNAQIARATNRPNFLT